jgi:hypothetical protein
VAYAYYDGTQTYGGTAGDLLTAKVEDGSGNTLDTSFYRYYKTESGGYAHALKYVFDPASYSRLVATLGSNVTSLTDSQVAPYAVDYLQYNSSQQVSQLTVQGAGASSGGGLGTYSYSYSTSTFSAGYNNWILQTECPYCHGASTSVAETCFALAA